MKKARDYYKKFISKLTSTPYNKMKCFEKDLNQDLRTYFNLDSDKTPFFNFDKNGIINKIGAEIDDLTSIAEDAIKGESKSKNLIKITLMS